MKKEYHGFRIEKVDISSEAIVVSSVGGCYTTNYMDLGVDSFNKCQYSIEEGLILEPITYNAVN